MERRSCRSCAGTQVRSVQQLSRCSKHQQSSRYALTSPQELSLIGYLKSSTARHLLFSSTSPRASQRSHHQQIIPRSGAHCSLLALLLRQISHSSRSRHRPPPRLPRPRSALPQPPAVMTPQQHVSALPMALLRASHQQQRLQTSSAASRCVLLASRNRRIPQLARTALAAHRDCASSHHRAAHTSYSIFISRWSSHAAT